MIRGFPLVLGLTSVTENIFGSTKRTYDMRLKVLLLGVTTMLAGAVTGMPPAAAHGTCTVYTAGAIAFGWVSSSFSASGSIDCSPTKHTYYELEICIERSELPAPLDTDYSTLACNYSYYDDSGGTGATSHWGSVDWDGPPCETKLRHYRARVTAHARNHPWQTYHSPGASHPC